MYQNLIRTMSLLTRRTANDVAALMELPGNIYLDYYKQVEQELVEEAKERKREHDRIKAQRQNEARKTRTPSMNNSRIRR